MMIFSEGALQNELYKLINSEIEEVNCVFTFNVHGNENNQKICELFIENKKLHRMKQTRLSNYQTNSLSL